MSSLWEKKEEHGGCGNCNLKDFCKNTLTTLILSCKVGKVFIYKPIKNRRF